MLTDDFYWIQKEEPCKNTNFYENKKEQNNSKYK